MIIKPIFYILFILIFFQKIKIMKVVLPLMYNIIIKINNILCYLNRHFFNYIYFDQRIHFKGTLLKFPEQNII